MASKGSSRATLDIMKEALAQAYRGRMHILGKMEEALAAPRPELSPMAPRLIKVMIPTDKIGMLIGPGGKNIRRIQDEYSVELTVEDDGSVFIGGVDALAVAQAKAEVEGMTAEPEIGKVGVPVNTLDDLALLFDGIPIEQINTSMTINATAMWLLALYVADGWRKGCERCIRWAFEFTRKRNNPKGKKLTLVAKTNVLTYGHDLWWRTFQDADDETRRAMLLPDSGPKKKRRRRRRGPKPGASADTGSPTAE